MREQRKGSHGDIESPARTVATCNSLARQRYNPGQLSLEMERSAAGAGPARALLSENCFALQKMSTGARLILILTLIVGAVMATASFFVLRGRERAFTDAMREELRAHAHTLQIALEEDYAAERAEEAQILINRLRANTGLYGIVLFDERGQVMMLSNTLTAAEIRQPPELMRVLESGEAAEFSRVVEGETLFCIIMPIHVGAGWRGAFEIAQPMSFVERDIWRTRRNFALTTLLLLVSMFLVVLVVTRRSISKPITELLGGARAVGHGDLSYRVIVPRGGGEFARLAQEFNRMADSLAEQRERAAREAEERLRLERELRHSERLASVGRLAAGVAHEMGAPLNVIDARAEQLLTKRDAAPEARERNLQIIRRQAARIGHIVRQLLTLARPYHLRRAPLDLNALLRETLEAVEANARGARVLIEHAACEDALTIEADADFMRQVFINIFTNALQAMPNGGRLRVACSDGAAPDGAPFVRVEISDTGPGIARELLPHIFDPFYTTKDVGSGTGLGLAVARRIVEEHGGSIRAANREGIAGATFTVCLPAAADAVNAPTASTAGAAPEEETLTRASAQAQTEGIETR